MNLDRQKEVQYIEKEEIAGQIGKLFHWCF
jgi:hypothetical protein